MEDKVKTCTIKKDHLSHWSAILVAEAEDPIEVKTPIGLDVGLKELGCPIQRWRQSSIPGYYAKTEQKLAVAQRNLSRKKKGSAK